MTAVSRGPYTMPTERKPFEKTAMAGPNVKSYQDNYNKFQPKSTPMSVPQYNVPDSNKWANNYKKLDSNSHPDFKPIYGPQDNKRPYNEMKDIYNKTKEKDEDEEKENVPKPKKEKETKEKKQLTPKKVNDSPYRRKNSYDEVTESPKRVTESPRRVTESPKRVTESPRRVTESPKRDKPLRDEKVPKQKSEQPKQTDKDIRPARDNYQQPQNRKPFDKNALVGPNVKSYNNDYDRKFPLKSNNMNVPEYKLGDGHKTYPKMDSTSHPDFHPVYGPQNNKRPFDITDVYKERKDKEKKLEPAKKIDKLPKDKKKEEKVPKEEPERNNVITSPKKEDKQKETPRKEQKETPRREVNKIQKDSPRREERKIQKDYSHPEMEDKEDEYYGYQERPVRKDDRKEPVTAELHQSKLKKKLPESERDNKQEPQATPRMEKKDTKKDDPKEKKEEKMSPRESRKDPYDPWKREEKEKITPKEKKTDPHDYRRKNEPEKRDEQKEVKRIPVLKPKDETRKDTQKEVNKEPPKRTTQQEPWRAPNRKREDESHLYTYTSRDHTRPTKAQNNNTSIVRDSFNPKQEKRNKPTAKVTPTARDTWDDKKRAPMERNDIKGRDERSVRSRYYGKAEIDDVLQDKIATQLRQNGIAETKVVPLSAKITQAVLDDVIDSNQTVSPQVTSNLVDVINKHLDPILFNRVNATDLRDAQKSNDAKHLSNLALLRIGQVHEEIELCKLSVEEPKNKRGKGQTPRSDPQDRSMIMAIKDGIEKQKTEKDILKDKLMQAQTDAQEAEDVIQKRQGQLQNLDADNWQLKQDLSDAEQSKQSLMAKLKEQQRTYDSLDKQHQDVRQENIKLKSRVNECDGHNQGMSAELAKLQSENARLKVLTSQKEKEILHLRDPDKDMVHRIRILNDEMTMLRTQTRRLNEEKALLKSRSQKMESSLEECNKQKGKLSVEKDNLQRENQDLKQRYRKMALANPQARTLPDITTGRNGPSYSGTPRTNSRAPSRSIRTSDDRRMSPTHEDDEDADYDR